MLTSLVVTSTHAGVADIQASSQQSYLISDNTTYSANLNDPGFVTNEMGGKFRPRYEIDNLTGRIGRVDLTNGVGAPSINLANSTGSNNNINATISNSVDSTLALRVAKLECGERSPIIHWRSSSSCSSTTLQTSFIWSHNQCLAKKHRVTSSSSSGSCGRSRGRERGRDR